VLSAYSNAFSLTLPLRSNGRVRAQCINDILPAMTNSRARQLRTASTDAERRLWSLLRNHRLDGHEFRRQHPIGLYIADFACAERMLIVEADGGQHADNPADQRRTELLQGQGWRVARFWNNDILRNTEGVAAAIRQALDSGTV
jgi:very-short-patch-repair endonuclease